MLAYLTAKPANASLICLIVALVLFVLATFESNYWGDRRQFFSLVPAGLAFVVLAFLLH
jgi:hypothetical protein